VESGFGSQVLKLGRELGGLQRGCRTGSLLRAPPLTVENSWRWAFLATAAAAALVLSTFIVFGQPSGHDVDFHLASWMDVALQWHQGVVFPRWAVWANYGFGEPRFIFYPPISWCLGALLGTALPWSWTPPVFIFLSVLIAGLSMHHLVRNWMPLGGAVAAAMIYAVNPYYLVVIYLRSDFAELLASSFLPLALHYALNVAGRGNARSRTDESAEHVSSKNVAWRNVSLLAIVYAVIWLTNAPTAVVASYALALMLAVCAIQDRSMKPLLAGAIGLVLGLALAGAYIVPAALEQKWVNIAQVVAEGLRFSDNFLFTAILDPEHNLFNDVVSWVAILTIVLAGVGAVISHRRAAESESSASQTRWTQMFVLCAVSVAVMFPFSSFAWAHLPELRFVQFPWRWLPELSVPLAFFLGEIFAHSRRRLVMSALLLVIWAGCGAGLMACAWWNSDEAPDTFASIQSGQGYEGTDEYVTLGADHYDLPSKTPEVSLVHPGDDYDPSTPVKIPNSRIVTGAWAPEHKVFTVDSPQPVRAALRLLDYPAWQVHVNGRQVQAESDSNTAQMLLTLPGGHSEIDVRFGRTQDRTEGDALSCFGIAVTAGMLLFSRHRASSKSA
jgi:hypothetical protein